MLDGNAPATRERRHQNVCYLSDSQGGFDRAVPISFGALIAHAQQLYDDWDRPVAGTRIPVYCDNSVQTVASFVACLQYSLVFVQVDPLWFQHHPNLIRQNQIRDTQHFRKPSSVGDTQKFQSNSDTQEFQSIPDTQKFQSIPDTQEFPSVDLYTLMNTAGDAFGSGRYGETLQWLKTIVQAPSSVALTQGYSANDQDFLIGFTSGSSGRPKAFVRTRQSWIESFRQSERAFGPCTGQTVLIAGPLSHGLSFYALAESLDAGGTVYLQQRFNAEHCADLMSHTALDRLVVVPTMLVSIISEIRRRAISDSEQSTTALAGESTPARRKPTIGPGRIICAGDKLSPALLEDVMQLWPDTAVSEYYGASELSFVSVAHASEAVPPDSVGTPFDGVTVSIEQAPGIPVPLGEVGQLYVQSGMLARGYLDEDGQTILPLQGVAHKTGYAATVGDIGKFDANGCLFLVDRASNMIITGGLNLYPATVERVMEQHWAIQGCRVLGIKDPLWGQRVVAVINLTQAGADLDTAAVKELIGLYAAKSLEPHQLPRQYFSIRDWPLNRSHKIDRNQLLQWLHAPHPSLTEL